MTDILGGVDVDGYELTGEMSHRLQTHKQSILLYLNATLDDDMDLFSTVSNKDTAIAYREAIPAYTEALLDSLVSDLNKQTFQEFLNAQMERQVVLTQEFYPDVSTYLLLEKVKESFLSTLDTIKIESTVGRLVLNRVKTIASRVIKIFKG